jgi:hypothetical protein
MIWLMAAFVVLGESETQMLIMDKDIIMITIFIMGIQLTKY